MDGSPSTWATRASTSAWRHFPPFTGRRWSCESSTSRASCSASPTSASTTTCSKTYEGIFTKPYGTILVTGPTGSGKSTTLYTTLTALNSPEKNIITVEDPVELRLQGINQVQLNIKAGLTFASALKSILRSDPDIVLVGEIRDKETAVIAIEAALTGHLVLATLHTNSAASTPMRLIEMELEPFLVTSSISGVLAQRLARRLCIHCKEPYEVTEAEILAAGWTPDEIKELSSIRRSSGRSVAPPARIRATVAGRHWPN